LDISGASVIRINDKSLTFKQLLQRLRVDPALAALDRCKADLTIECWAETLGMSVEASAMREHVTRFRRANGLFTVAQTNEWLEAKGMSLEALHGLLRPQALRAALAQHVVTDEEIGRHYLECAREFDSAEISVIATPEYGVAQELLFRMEEGADFHMLARAYSSDASTAKSGGYAGVISRDDLVPEAAAAVFGAAAGAVLGPFEHKRLFSLYLVEATFPAELDETRAGIIRERLFQDKLAACQRTLDIYELI